ncbi:hypothetical protein D5F01_LYC05826 [Larimichthys crocea]|uniref:THAP domain-containing protein 1 n=1 Tax=Larimichthys crocea TaxID=215358 RepID=A0A6G0IU91_LARCR|nr:hypothetical protein D5F01_LYC05826 [Larimichthys crocea]
MPSSRKCVFPGCRNLQSSSVTLFKFPRDEQLKRRWVDFVVGHGDRELKITTNTRLCSDHFTPESFTNFQRRLLGFTDNPLLLVTGAAPTVSLPGLHPAAPTITLPGLHPAAPPITLPGLHPAAPTISLPGLHPAAPTVSAKCVSVRQAADSQQRGRLSDGPVCGEKDCGHTTD